MGDAVALGPAGPELNVTVGALVLTVNVCAAGVASVLPAASVARTWKVCEPSARAAVVRGDVHAANAAASTLHSNVDPASVAPKAKVGVVSLVGEAIGVSVVSGGVRSTWKSQVASVGSVFRAVSVATTWKR